MDVDEALGSELDEGLQQDQIVEKEDPTLSIDGNGQQNTANQAHDMVNDAVELQSSEGEQASGNALTDNQAAANSEENVKEGAEQEAEDLLGTDQNMSEQFGKDDLSQQEEDPTAFDDHALNPAEIADENLNALEDCDGADAAVVGNNDDTETEMINDNRNDDCGLPQSNTVDGGGGDTTQKDTVDDQREELPMELPENTEEGVEDQPADNNKELVEDSEQGIEDAQQPDESTEQPVEDSEQATDDAQQPEETEQLVEDNEQATDDAQQPDESTEQPVEDSEQATDDAQQPDESTEQPVEDSEQATDDAQQPEETQQPVEDSEQATDDAQQPDESTEQLVEDSEQATDDAQQPDESTEQPVEDSEQGIEDAQQPPENTEQPVEDTEKGEDLESPEGQASPIGNLSSSDGVNQQDEEVNNSKQDENVDQEPSCPPVPQVPEEERTLENMPQSEILDQASDREKQTQMDDALPSDEKSQDNKSASPVNDEEAPSSPRDKPTDEDLQQPTTDSDSKDIESQDFAENIENTTAITALESMENKTSEVSQQGEEEKSDESQPMESSEKEVENEVTPTSEPIEAAENALQNQEEMEVQSDSTADPSVIPQAEPQKASELMDDSAPAEKQDSADSDKVETSSSEKESTDPKPAAGEVISIEDTTDEKESKSDDHKESSEDKKKVDISDVVTVESDSAAENVKSDIKATSSFEVKERRHSKSPTITPHKGEATKESSSKSKTPQKCIVCQKVGKCKYNIVRNGDIKHLCDDKCFKIFRANPTSYLKGKNEATSNGTPTSNNSNSSASSICGFCQSPIPSSKQGMFNIKLGTESKSFCSSDCQTEFKKKQKRCSFCNEDILNSPSAIVAPVQNGQFLDFCSIVCHTKYEKSGPPPKTPNNKQVDDDVEIVGTSKTTKSGSTTPKSSSSMSKCSVCGKTSTIKHEVTFNKIHHKLCSDPCFAAFRYANKLSMTTCDNCKKICQGENNTNTIQFLGQSKKFCNAGCMNTFKTKNQKITPCTWCQAKKSNFDMVERVDDKNKTQLFCSLNCLSLYRVNLQATSNQNVICDQCKRFAPAQYHLTMSDASVRNFCAYNCVMAFQSKFQQPQSGAGRGQPGPASRTTPTTGGATSNRGGRGRGTRVSARGKSNAERSVSTRSSLTLEGSKSSFDIDETLSATESASNIKSFKRTRKSLESTKPLATVQKLSPMVQTSDLNTSTRSSRRSSLSDSITSGLEPSKQRKTNVLPEIKIAKTQRKSLGDTSFSSESDFAEMQSYPQVKIKLEKILVPKAVPNSSDNRKVSMVTKTRTHNQQSIEEVQEGLSKGKVHKKHIPIQKKQNKGWFLKRHKDAQKTKTSTRSNSGQMGNSGNKQNKHIGKQILSRYLKVQLNPILVKGTTVKLGSLHNPSTATSKLNWGNRRLTRKSSEGLELPFMELKTEQSDKASTKIKKKVKRLRLKGQFKRRLSIKSRLPMDNEDEQPAVRLETSPTVHGKHLKKHKKGKIIPAVKAQTLTSLKQGRNLRRISDSYSDDFLTKSPKSVSRRETRSSNSEVVTTPDVKQEVMTSNPRDKKSSKNSKTPTKATSKTTSPEIKSEGAVSPSTPNVNSTLLKLFNKRIPSPVKNLQETQPDEFTYEDNNLVPRQMEARKLKKLRRLGIISVDDLPDVKEELTSPRSSTVLKKKGKKGSKVCDNKTVKKGKLKNKQNVSPTALPGMVSLSYEEIKAQTGVPENPHSTNSNAFANPYFQQPQQVKAKNKRKRSLSKEKMIENIELPVVAHRTRRSTSVSEKSDLSYTVVERDLTGNYKLTKQKGGSQNRFDLVANANLSPTNQNIFDEVAILKKSPRGYSDDKSPVSKKKRLSKILSPKKTRGLKLLPPVNQKLSINCETQTDDVIIMPLKKEVDDGFNNPAHWSNTVHSSPWNTERSWVSALESFSRKTSLQSSQIPQQAASKRGADNANGSNNQQVSPGGSDKENSSTAGTSRLALLLQTPPSSLSTHFLSGPSSGPMTTGSMPVTTAVTDPVPIRRSSREKKLSGWFKKILANKSSASPATGRAAAAQNQPTMPMISQVVSLAPDQVAPAPGDPKTPILAATPNVHANVQATKTVTKTVKETTTQTKVMIQPIQTRTMRNKSLLCKPFTQTKATSCRPHAQSKETQTDDDLITKPALVPVPIPLYMPAPMAMYSIPVPYPVPIPIPIPVPCFIPTTKKSAASIMKHITKIQSSMPADPFEAELLAMAAAVAGEEKESSSESEDDTQSDAFEPDDSTSLALPPAPVQTPVTTMESAEDMLQMAMRMASTMPTAEPAMDMENSLTPTPINPSNTPMPTYASMDSPDLVTPEHTPRGRGRGKRRGGSSSSRSTRSKKMKTEEEPPPPEPIQVVPQQPPPDENMVLKFTYGVNAWKHWVMQKNEQLQKASTRSRGRLKLYKTDILACTPDELNFSLCQFVNEVRKPNGEEYAPDSIYYLCLGIQEYIYENGRVDNIFTDVYYDRFTECLNEVIQRYEVRLNAQGLIVCRIEEEHLWESKQLGAHSPFVLLNTLIYFNARYFMLRTPEEHLRLSFSHIMKHWKKTNMPGTRQPGRSVYLRYYAPVHQAEVSNKRRREDLPVFEQGENVENPLRCPVKLYEFYLSKCPESIKNRNDVFYLMPERSCVPDSPVWYSTGSLPMDIMARMLNRIRVIKEIQEAHLASYHPPLGMV